MFSDRSKLFAFRVHRYILFPTIRNTLAFIGRATIIIPHKMIQSPAQVKETKNFSILSWGDKSPLSPYPAI